MTCMAMCGSGAGIHAIHIPTKALGKLVVQMSAPLRRLFAAMTPAEGDDAPTREHKAQLAAVFDTMLGKEDRGRDDARFEADLLGRRLDRVEAEQKIVDALDELRARFADDALNTGEMVVRPGLRALEVARAAAASSPAFKSLLAPALNALSDMTKGARRHQEAARKGAKGEGEKPAAPK